RRSRQAHSDSEQVAKLARYTDRRRSLPALPVLGSFLLRVPKRERGVRALDSFADPSASPAQGSFALEVCAALHTRSAYRVLPLSCWPPAHDASLSALAHSPN